MPHAFDFFSMGTQLDHRHHVALPGLWMFYVQPSGPSAYPCGEVSSWPRISGRTGTDAFQAAAEDRTPDSAVSHRSVASSLVDCMESILYSVC